MILVVSVTIILGWGQRGNGIHGRWYGRIGRHQSTSGFLMLDCLEMQTELLTVGMMRIYGALGGIDLDFRRGHTVLSIFGRLLFPCFLLLQQPFTKLWFHQMMNPKK